MSNVNDSLEYDEVDAVKFIVNFIPQELKEKITGDDINYIIDVVYEFYEKKGFMDENTSDEDLIELDEDELIDYVAKNIRRDDVKEFSRDEITFVIQGELKYCESIGMFE